MTPSQAEVLVARINALSAEFVGFPEQLSDDERATETELRSQAAKGGAELPLDRLTQTFDLSAFEQEVILLCAAPEIDPAYERLYAFVLDDLNRRAPCIELACSLTAASFDEKLTRQRELGKFGLLRRVGLIQTRGEHGPERRRELQLGPGLFEFLTGAPGDPTIRFRDGDAVATRPDPALPPNIANDKAAWLRDSIDRQTVRTAVIWGPRQAGHADLVHWLSAHLHRPLRVIPDFDPGRKPAEIETLLREALEAASALNAIVWLPLHTQFEPPPDRIESALASALTGSSATILITSTNPLRPTQLIESPAYAEMELRLPDFAERQQMWRSAFPLLAPMRAADLAARFRLGSSDIRTVEQIATTSGAADPEAACAIVTRRRSANFATIIQPRRTKADLVLPDDLHQQVLEVASFFRLWPRVGEEGGFARRQTGAGGVKALFTGDPGTGKTLAAEVIAGELNLQLLRVDLASITSKWVGETEKNLESVFREAEESYSVLFFDEADALFGKRSEVQHGADRYANLEVGYLLQRLEDHYGLVILSSNLKDQIDNAFLRRFQIVLNFPRPAEAERLKIFQLEFPEDRFEGLDLQQLARLDLTGAAISSIAQTAALLAADEGAPSITMVHLARATARQFRREARVFAAHQLGPHAALLRGAL